MRKRFICEHRLSRPKPFVPPPLEAGFPIFHWAPESRRLSIARKGLVPGSLSIDRVWRPPYVCYARDPELAWELSGRLHKEIEIWDLWMTHSDVPSGMEAIIDCARDTGLHYVKEYRVYERVYKRDLWHVGIKANV